MANAECYQKTVDDRTIILNARSYYIQPFAAGGWTDLRLGFFLSLTEAVNDDLTTGLAETIAGSPFLGPQDRYWIGAVLGPGHPGTDNGVFLGFTNAFGAMPNNRGDSALLTSDAAVGTTNANFWRPANVDHPGVGAGIFDGRLSRALLNANVEQHFPQVSAGAGGYAVLLAIQLLRDHADSKTITARIKSSAHSADWIYSDTPTKELIHATMETWPPSAQMGPVSLSRVPIAFYFYWPFRKSRLRVHSLGLLRAT